jgi:hypothetical protein
MSNLRLLAVVTFNNRLLATVHSGLEGPMPRPPGRIEWENGVQKPRVTDGRRPQVAIRAIAVAVEEEEEIASQRFAFCPPGYFPRSARRLGG